MEKEKQLKFDKEELTSLYKIVKEYSDELPEDMDDWYHPHSDFDEEPISKKMVLSILKEIEKTLPKEEKESIDRDFLREKYHSFNNEIDEEVYEIIEKAFNQLRSIEIEYFNIQSAEFKKRNVDVYYKSRKYVIGYCHLRKDMRKFRTSRIGSAKILDRKYKIPEDFDKNEY